MKVIIGDRTRQNMKTLGILSYPFTEDELKTAYRETMNRDHPDKPGGSNEKAKEVNIAKTELENLAMHSSVIDASAKEVIQQHEKEQEDLFSHIYWEKCKPCSGTGKIVHETIDKHHRSHFTVDRCWDCFGVGKFKINPFNPVIPHASILKK